MSSTFAQITDHHLLSTRTGLIRGFTPAYSFQAVMGDIASRWGSQLDFVVSTGDIAHSGSACEYDHMKQLLEISGTSSPPGPLLMEFEGFQGLPLYLLPGNHDCRRTLTRTLFSGEAPGAMLSTSFVFSGVQFICLDLGTENQGELGPDTVLFLEEQLGSNLPSVILSHHHLVGTDSERSRALLPPNIDLLWELVGQSNVLAVLSGHIHADFEARVGSIPIYCTRSTSFQFVEHEGKALSCLRPPGYRVVEIDDDLTVRIQECEVPLGVDADWP